MAFWSSKKKRKTGLKKKLTRPMPAKKAKPAKSKPKGPAKNPGPKPKHFAPLEVKLLAMEGREAGVSIEELAELANVSTTTINKWWSIYEKGGTAALCRKPSTVAANRQCRALNERIIAHRKEHPERGVRRIRDELKRSEGLQVSAETVRQVVNEAGLGNAPVKPRRKPPQERRFERSIPNSMWQVDIFTFQLKRMYRVYLIAIMDDHSRYIVGWGLFRRQTADAVLEVTKGAIGEWGAPREILSDNGRQFAAWRGRTRFQKVCAGQGIQHVRSAPHHPMTLGKIERFWRTIWEEFLAEASFASFADAYQRIGFWIKYYNHQRTHQGINGACPADRFYGLANDVDEAIRQGCKDNALRLALGQVPRPPLYLMGKLGNTDVRVTRNGEEIEVKLGDKIHEVIRMTDPFEIDAQGQSSRGESSDEVEANECSGTISCGGDGADGSDPEVGALPEAGYQSADAGQGHQDGRSGCCGGAGTQGSGSERQVGPGYRVGEAEEAAREAREGTRGLEDEVRYRQGFHRPATEDGRGETSSGRESLEGEKKEATEKEVDLADYDGPWWNWPLDEDGL
jgi:transposase InsO family protein